MNVKADLQTYSVSLGCWVKGIKDMKKVIIEKVKKLFYARIVLSSRCKSSLFSYQQLYQSTTPTHRSLSLSLPLSLSLSYSLFLSLFLLLFLVSCSVCHKQTILIFCLTAVIYFLSVRISWKFCLQVSGTVCLTHPVRLRSSSD